MLENRYQSQLIDTLEELLPGCIILKNDSSYRQGIPDLLVLYGARWAALEVKSSENAKQRPNQEYFVTLMNEMSFSAFIYPENEGEVLYALQQTLRSRG